jgi:predicted amidohydrolase
VSKDSQKSFLCACVQFDVRRGDVARNRSAAVAGLRQAAAQGARLAVLPELWTTSFVPEVGDGLLAESLAAEQEVIDLSGELGLVIVGGGIEREGSATYNRALVIDSGAVLGRYRKVHLFSVNAEQRTMTAGDRPLIADTSVGRIGVVICYDLRFPELVRYYFYRHVEILVVTAQWPEARATHWRTLLRARAIENEMFVVGCNRTGHETSLKNDELLVFPGNSRIVDPMGEPLTTGTGDDGPVLAEIEKRKIQAMRRLLPLLKDRRPQVYQSIWQPTWRDQASVTRTPGDG